MHIKNESYGDEEEDAIDKEVKGIEEKRAWKIEEEEASVKVHIV